MSQFANFYCLYFLAFTTFTLAINVVPLKPGHITKFSGSYNNNQDLKLKVWYNLYLKTSDVQGTLDAVSHLINVTSEKPANFENFPKKTRGQISWDNTGAVVGNGTYAVLKYDRTPVEFMRNNSLNHYEYPSIERFIKDEITCMVQLNTTHDGEDYFELTKTINSNNCLSINKAKRGNGFNLIEITEYFKENLTIKRRFSEYEDVDATGNFEKTIGGIKFEGFIPLEGNDQLFD